MFTEETTSEGMWSCPPCSQWPYSVRRSLPPAVNPLGKWKTALQMVAMSVMLVLRNGDHLLGDSPPGKYTRLAPCPGGVEGGQGAWQEPAVGVGP